MSVSLPEQFADLELYADTWALATEPERWDRRMASSMPEMLDFYSAFFPRLEEAIEFCDQHPIADVPPDVERLLHLIYSLVMVSMSIEVFGQVRPTDSARAVLVRVRDPRP